MTESITKTNLNGGKGESLKRLERIPSLQVPAFTIIQADEVNSHTANNSIIEFLEKHPNLKSVAVRSSGLSEDGHQASFAGAYQTFLNVAANPAEISKAIESILNHAAEKSEELAQYAKKRNTEANKKVAVVIQEMIEDPDYSGVIFSHNPDQKDTYLRLNFSSGLGENIVGGSKNGKQFKILRNSQIQGHPKIPFLNELLTATYEIEKEYKSQSLDIEFCYKDGQLYILQARPLTAHKESSKNLDQEAAAIQEHIERIESRVLRTLTQDLYGDMIDINPRELLGENPSPINISIFRKIFADDIVERTRAEIGYSPLSAGLLETVANKPYVSLRSSAYSFRPKGITNEIYDKLVSFYLEKVEANPELQNRVEFEVFVMSNGQYLEEVLEKVDLIPEEKSQVRNAFHQLEVKLEERAAKVQERYADELRKLISDIQNLNSQSRLEEILDTLRRGTYLFVIVARLAFYSKVRAEANLTPEELERQLIGLHTMSSELQNDLLALQKGEQSRGSIIEKYGHLRPGQLNIFAETYREDPDYYLFQNEKIAEEITRPDANENSQNGSQLRFFLEAREEVKFHFMKAFEILANKIKALGTIRGLSQAESEKLELEAFEDPENLLNRQAREDIPNGIILPSVIQRSSNLRIIESLKQNGTYISKSKIKGEVIYLKKGETIQDVKGKIILIDSADPGFDYLFNLPIAGLITKVGGPASHMCIRAIEMNTPACIGIGDEFDKIKKQSRIILDCPNQQIITE